MKIPKSAKRNIKKQLNKPVIKSNGTLPVKSQVTKTTHTSTERPQKKIMYSFNEGDLVTTNPKDRNFEDTSSICLVLDYDEGEYLTVWRPTGAFSARASAVRIIQRA